MKLKFQYGSNGPIGRQLAAWQNSLFPGYVSFRRLQFHHQNRLIISLINKGANTWIITQPPYSHNFCRSKTAINNRELLYVILSDSDSLTCLIITFFCLSLPPYSTLKCNAVATWSNVSKPDNWDGTERRGDFVLYRARSNPPPLARRRLHCKQPPCPSVRPTVCLAAAAAAPFSSQTRVQAIALKQECIWGT